MTKNIPSLNLELWNDFYAKKVKKHEKIELRQAPIQHIITHFLCTGVLGLKLAQPLIERKNGKTTKFCGSE